MIYKNLFSNISNNITTHEIEKHVFSCNTNLIVDSLTIFVSHATLSIQYRTQFQLLNKYIYNYI